MKLTLNTPYTIPGGRDPVESFEKKCITNSRLYKAIHNQAGSDVEIIREETIGDQYIREALVHPRPEAVPGAIKTFAGTDALDFRESTTYDLSRHSGVTETSLLAGPFQGKVSAKTSFSVRSAAPFNPRGVRHVLDTEITAKIWLIGSQLEKTMAKEIEKKQPEIQKLTQQTLESEGQAERLAA